MMKIIASVLLVAVLAACSRAVEVNTTPGSEMSDVSVHMTNNLSQAVDVYVVSGGTDLFLGRVNANSDEMLRAGGIASGSSVTLRATTADGESTYSKTNVMLSGMYAWQVP
ncbi:MAG: hypothetical protein ACRENI_10610 [Gemmatimonadaceae bacterium]